MTKRNGAEGFAASTLQAQARPGYPHSSSAATTAVMRGNRRTSTKPEMLVRRALHTMGLRYRVDLPVQIPGGWVRPDIVFTRKRIAVFMTGG